MNELLKFLSSGDHPVDLSSRHKSREAVNECLARGHVLIKFTDTRGGTELGVTIDRTRSDLGGHQNGGGSPEIRLVGELTLDYVPVTCIARIDLTTLQGEGHLEIRQDNPVVPDKKAMEP